MYRNITGYRPHGKRVSEIAADVEAAIAAGRAPAGTILPPVRTLAAELGVSAGTVAGAYRLLAERGLVEGRTRAGTVVRGRPGSPKTGAPTEPPPGTRDLARGNPDPDLLPVPTPRRAERHLYGGDPVLPELRERVREAFLADGIDVEAVTVASGALDAIERAFQARLSPGARVAVEDPGYAGLFDLLTVLDLIPEPVAIDAEGMIPDALEHALDAGARAVVITPRAQNPTGAALTPQRARALRARIPHHVLTIEDDYAGPIAGAAAPATIDPDLLIRSCSKWLGPDLRVALVGGTAEATAAVQARLAAGAGWVSHILQQAVLDLVTDPALPGRLEEAGQIYKTRRDALTDALGLPRTPSGLNVWVPVADEAATTSLLATNGWAVSPGARHRIASPPAIRITISTLKPEEASTLAADVARATTTRPPRRSG